MRVHCDEGVATHIGPEPCADIREDVGEASAGERTGQPLSRERTIIPDADAVSAAEGETGGCASASVRPIRRDPGMYGRSLHGNREVSWSAMRPGPRQEGEEP